MRFNAKVVLLSLGLGVGGAFGAMTSKFGSGLFGLALEENERVFVFAAAGGFIGLLAGFAVGRR